MYAVLRPLMVTAAVLAVPRVAAAGPRIAIAAGGCPSRDAMIFAVAQVVPTASIVSTPALLDGGDPIAAITVSDDGPSYQVQVGTTARTFFDPTLRCEERAQKAAVVVALALEPPQFGAPVPGVEPPVAGIEPPESDVEPPAAGIEPPVIGLAPPAMVVVQRVPAAPFPAAPPGPRFDVWFDAGAVAEWARRPGADTLRLNEVAARVTVERGPVGVAFGAAWSGWISGDGYRYGTLVERDPIELLAHVRHGVGPLAVALDFGPALVIQRSYMGTRLTQAEFDVRADARLELRSRWGYGVYAAVTATYAPRPLGEDPYDTGAMLPSTWIGAAAGLMIQVH